MPKFSQESFSKLSTCEMDLQVLFYEVIKTIDCIVLEGYRDKEAQDRAFEDGNSQLKWPYGKHNSQPSCAVDVSPYPVDWKNINRFYWFAGFVMAIAQKLKEDGKITHAIRYGGDWDQDYDIADEHGLRDLVHFDLIL